MRLRLAVAAGHGLDFYDFAVYGFFALAIAHSFFPEANPHRGLLSAFAVYGVAFAFRPLGGVLFGVVGDRWGRRTALAAPMGLMAVAALAMAVLPTYDQVGVAAPILLVVTRAVQGLSFGGVFIGAAVFLVEHAPADRRGRWVSAASGSGALGSTAGALLALGLSATLSPGDFDDWGWRLAFLSGIPVAAAGLFIRTRLEDTGVFRRMADGRAAGAPRRERERLRGPMALIAACAAVSGVGFYYLVTYATTFLQTTGEQLPRSTALAIVAACLALLAACCPIAGGLSDRFGRRPTMLVGTAGIGAAAFPAFAVMGTGVPGALVGLAVLAPLQALLSVTTGVLLVELLPASSRMVRGALGYNLAIATIVAPGPLIAAALADRLDVAGSASLYLVGVAAVALVVLARWLPETRGRSLDPATGPGIAPGAGSPPQRDGDLGPVRVRPAAG